MRSCFFSNSAAALVSSCILLLLNLLKVLPVLSLNGCELLLVVLVTEEVQEQLEFRRSSGIGNPVHRGIRLLRRAVLSRNAVRPGYEAGPRMRNLGRERMVGALLRPRGQLALLTSPTCGSPGWARSRLEANAR